MHEPTDIHEVGKRRAGPYILDVIVHLNYQFNMYDTHQRVEQDSFVRHLNVLEVPKSPPDLDALKELAAAQMTRGPLENISKLYYRKSQTLEEIPDMQTYLDGIE